VASRVVLSSKELVGWLVSNLPVQLLLGLARAVTLRSKSRRTQTIFYDHLKLPQPGGTGPRIYITQEQGGPVIPRALRSLFVASYDSQGYGGSILTRLHTGWYVTPMVKSKSKLYYDRRSVDLCLGVRHSSGARDQNFPLLSLIIFRQSRVC
jgi:hypothetical protein